MLANYKLDYHLKLSPLLFDHNFCFCQYLTTFIEYFDHKLSMKFIFGEANKVRSLHCKNEYTLYL